MPGILALDLATRTGWALARPGRQHLSGVHRVAPEGSGLAYFLCQYRDWLDAQVVTFQPAAIFYEAPLPRIANNKHSNINNTEIAFGLSTLTLVVAADRGVRRCTPIHHSTIKVFATGTNRADGDMMIAAARARGYDPQDDNEADALALLDYAIVKLAPRSETARRHFLGLDLPLTGAMA